MEIGTLAYWPPGSAFCIFYGPTPASNCDQPRAASPVNIVGCITDDATVLRHITSGPQVRLDKKVRVDIDDETNCILFLNSK